jgi:hypothetical protein
MSRRHLWRSDPDGRRPPLLRAALGAGRLLGGGTIRCSRCGGEIGQVIPVMRQGRLRVLGLKRHVVRVSFSAQDEIEFTHLALHECQVTEVVAVPEASP